MQRRDSQAWGSRALIVGSAAVAVLALTMCKKSATAPGYVASSDLITPVTKANVAAIDGMAFTFPSGGGAISPVLANQTITVTITNTSAATPTATVTAPGGTFVANLTFGSCVFTVTASTIPGIGAGAVFYLPLCNLNFTLYGVPADGLDHPVVVRWLFGTFTSNPVTIIVKISSTGTVTVGLTTVGTVSTKPNT